MCIIGSTVMVIHSPKEEQVDTLEDLLQKLTEPGKLFKLIYCIAIFIINLLCLPCFLGFIIYTSIMLIIIFSIFFYFGPRYGSSNVVVYVIMCSTSGSLTVMWCKGLGLAIRETISGMYLLFWIKEIILYFVVKYLYNILLYNFVIIGQSEFTNWLTYMFIVLLITFVCIQMNYLNKALDTFNTSVVTPVYYVMFTTLVITASAILFKEWEHLQLNVLGFINTVIKLNLKFFVHFSVLYDF